MQAVFFVTKRTEEWWECRVREVNTNSTVNMSIIHRSIVFIVSV